MYTVLSTGLTSTAFRYTYSPATTASGSCYLGQSGINYSTSYAVTVIDSNTVSIVSSFSTFLLSNWITVSYTSQGNSQRAASGGAGALNSAQYFIRYYNGAYTPGYFGVGAGGGGGGGTSNTYSEAGNGGAGGIGAGGGGQGRSGPLANTRTVFNAISGRGGPGMVMFIYALRANNQSGMQGM